MAENNTSTTAASWPKPRTDLDLDHFRKRLNEEKTLAEDTISRLRGSAEDGTGMMGMEANELSESDENHPGDAATELQMREQDRGLIENAQNILHKIARAFEKMDEGTYGLSDRSHAKIPKARLEAVPYAAFTVEEQDIVELS